MNPIWLVSGLQASGKTILIRNYYKHHRETKLMGNLGPKYTVLRELGTVEDGVAYKPDGSRLHVDSYDVIEYNIFHPYIVNRISLKEERPYRKEPVWSYYNTKPEIMDRLNILVFIAPHAMLLSRLRTKYYRKNDKKAMKKFQLLAPLYKKKDTVALLYSRWLRELSARRLPHKLISLKTMRRVKFMEDVL